MHHTVREVSLKNGVKGLLINVPQATVMSFDFNLRAGYYLAPEGKWETRLSVPILSGLEF